MKVLLKKLKTPEKSITCFINIKLLQKSQYFYLLQLNHKANKKQQKFKQK